MITEREYQIFRWAIDFLITAASIYFLYCFTKLKEKNYGIYLILILCISDWIYPIMNLIIMLCVQNSEGYKTFCFLGDLLIDFALFWSTAIAIFFYGILTSNKPFKPKKYMFWAFTTCALAALTKGIMVILGIFGAECKFSAPGLYSLSLPEIGVENTVGSFLIYDAFGKLLPIAVTLYCYSKVFSVLRVVSKTHPNIYYKTQPFRVLLYSGVQVICFVPGVLIDCYNMFISSNQNYSDFQIFFTFVVFILHHSWGFLNLLVYWFLRSDEEKRRLSSLSETPSNQISLTLSNI